MKDNSLDQTPSASGQQQPLSPSPSPQTLDEVRLAQAKADLRVTLLIGDNKEADLAQKAVDLEKSKLEVRAGNQTFSSQYIT